MVNAIQTFTLIENALYTTLLYCTALKYNILYPPQLYSRTAQRSYKLSSRKYQFQLPNTSTVECDLVGINRSPESGGEVSLGSFKKRRLFEKKRSRIVYVNQFLSPREQCLFPWTINIFESSLETCLLFLKSRM